MSSQILIKGGSIAAEDNPDLLASDILIGEGVIKAVAPSLPEPEGAKVIDATGKIILPGMFDLHVHLREPGQSSRETIASGSEAAINGGVTGLVAMPDTSPAIDNGGLVRSVLGIAKRDARIPIYTSGCITKGREGEEMAPIAGMKSAGAVMITDGGSPVSNSQLLRRAMEYAREFALPVASHCETTALSGAGAMNEGRVSYKMGLPGIPTISEEICISRDIQIARYTGAHLHIQQVSTARGMELIRRAKDDGVHVTCEVSAHHLIFSEEHIVDFDTHLKVNPPLRTQADNERLLSGLAEGVFDVIATDHAPHTEFEKQQLDFSSAPFGITGLETVIPSMYHYFIKLGKLGWDTLVRHYSSEPRRLLGLEEVRVSESKPADLVLFDPEAKTTFSKSFMRSKASNTPFLGETLDGRVDTVVLGDTILLER